MSAGELWRWRKRLNLNRSQAGLLLDLSERMIAYYESGQREIPFSTYINCIAYENWPSLKRKLEQILQSRYQLKQCT